MPPRRQETDKPVRRVKQWYVTLAGLSTIQKANSHQTAKKLAVEYWASGNGNPEKYKEFLQKRIAEKYKNGIHATLLHDYAKPNAPVQPTAREEVEK